MMHLEKELLRPIEILGWSKVKNRLKQVVTVDLPPEKDPNSNSKPWLKKNSTSIGYPGAYWHPEGENIIIEDLSS